MARFDQAQVISAAGNHHLWWEPLQGRDASQGVASTGVEVREGLTVISTATAPLGSCLVNRITATTGTVPDAGSPDEAMVAACSDWATCSR